MQPTRFINGDRASTIARVRDGLVRLGIVFALTLATACVLVPAAGSESLLELGSTAENTTDAESRSAEASNGGVGSATTGGDIEIDQIVTGENTGDTIATGDVVGSADINGGENAYSAELSVSMNIGPQTVDASGGDGGVATSSDDSPTDGDDRGTNGANDEITIINRNDNRSKAKVIDKSRN